MPKIPEENNRRVSRGSSTNLSLVLRVRQYGKSALRHIWLIELKGKEVTTEIYLMYGEMDVEASEVVVEQLRHIRGLRIEFEHVGLEEMGKTFVTVNTSGTAVVPM